MSGISLRFSADLDRLSADLAKIHGKVELAIARGLNEGGDKVRTQVRAAMRTQTGLVRLNSVTSRSSTIRAYGTGTGPKDAKALSPRGVPQTPGPTQGPFKGASLSYTIVFHGKPSTRPEEFVYRVKKGPGGGVTVRMWGVDHKFKRSFQITGKTGAWGLEMRIGKPREPMRGFDGPNLAGEAIKEGGLVASTFLTLAPSLVPPMIEKHLGKLL